MRISALLNTIFLTQHYRSNKKNSTKPDLFICFYFAVPALAPASPVRRPYMALPVLTTPNVRLVSCHAVAGSVGSVRKDDPFLVQRVSAHHVSRYEYERQHQRQALHGVLSS